ncbi:MAG TPA: putative zinc-binding protein [Telluria sp.]
MREPDKKLPLVYSCSGCSSAAQTANHVALRLDRMQAAEMSCIAGVGGGVAPLVRLARSGRTILAIDGCAMACARHCLEREGVTPDHHLQLGEHGVKKRQHTDFDPAQAAEALAQALRLLAQPAKSGRG